MMPMYEAERKMKENAKKKSGTAKLPVQLKSRMERMSGFGMDDVRVHYNSPMPQKMQAQAYTQGTDIHVAPGQEQHLAHEAWHVVQQKQDRVPVMAQRQGMPVNDSEALENEADRMGQKARESREGSAPVQFYNRGAHSFSAVNRNAIQPGPKDGLGNLETRSPLAGTGLQRDHIIPMDIIKSFADVVFNNPTRGKVKTAGNEWLEAAGDNLVKRGNTLRTNKRKMNPNGNDTEGLNFYISDNGTFLGNVDSKDLRAYIKSNRVQNAQAANAMTDDEYFMMLTKAITWMPSNIFIAPHPKADDPGNGLDTTAKTVKGLGFRLYEETYELMKNAIANNTNVELQKKALAKLKQIAGKRDSPWEFSDKEWEWDPDIKQWRANIFKKKS